VETETKLSKEMKERRKGIRDECRKDSQLNFNKPFSLVDF
jgi:hypothetical protein